MYEDFFRFAAPPFRNSPDPSFFFRSANHRDALAMLSYGIRDGKGFLLVTGDVGTGKTMLVQALKSELGESALVIEVAYPWVSAEEIIAAVRARIGLPAVASEGPEAIEVLRQRLMELAAEKREVVLVIDEAHQLPVKTLEGIRLISNIESNTRKLLQIVLLGQEELGTLLSQYSLRQVQQRIALSCHLRPLTRPETGEYIRHRLRVANGSPELFSPGAAERIYDYSGGCPRLINQACDYCLLYAYGKFAPAVDEALAREALANMLVTRGVSHVAERLTAEPVMAPTLHPGAQEQATKPEVVLQPPITIPGAGRPSFAAGDQGPSPGGGGLRVIGTLLVLLALVMGASALWLALEKRKEAPIATSKAVGPNTEAMRHGSAQGPAHEPASRLGLELPGRTSAEERRVQTSRDLSLALLASQQYGAWNATVRDLLVGANPQFPNLDSVPPGTSVNLPAPNRRAMIVQDLAGQRYIYYASFESEEAASAELESLRRVWNKVVLVNAERATGRVFRVYLGPYQTAPEAENVLSALWFKFLPTLSSTPLAQ